MSSPSSATKTGFHIAGPTLNHSLFIALLRPLQELFKAKQFAGSVQFYSLALKVAVERMPWEAGQFQREELSVLLCNRAAAYGALDDVRFSSL